MTMNSGKIGDHISGSFPAIHLFGSSADGSYHLDLATDEYQPTKFILSIIIPKFVSVFGSPDCVMFHTSQWDIRCQGSATIRQ